MGLEWGWGQGGRGVVEDNSASVSGGLMVLPTEKRE